VFESPRRSPFSHHLDRYLPEYQWRTIHSIDVHAPQAVCYEALIHSNIRVGWIDLLVWIRGMNARASLKEFFTENGFVTLEENPPCTFVVGLICQPWKVGGNVCFTSSLHEWLTSDRPDFAKITALFGVEQIDAARSRLYTETRIQVTDGRTQRKFAGYWFLIKPFSGHIRHGWLKRTREIAESSVAV